jgi:hypothetical protein
VVGGDRPVGDQVVLDVRVSLRRGRRAGCEHGHCGREHGGHAQESVPPHRLPLLLPEAVESPKRCVRGQGRIGFAEGEARTLSTWREPAASSRSAASAKSART